MSCRFGDHNGVLDAKFWRIIYFFYSNVLGCTAFWRWFKILYIWTNVLCFCSCKSQEIHQFMNIFGNIYGIALILLPKIICNSLKTKNKGKKKTLFKWIITLVLCGARESNWISRFIVQILCRLIYAHVGS